MTDEIEKADAEELPQNISKQITLTDLMQLAHPLIDTYTKSQVEQKKQEYEYDLKALQIQSRQNIVLIICLFFVLFIVLIISGYLYFQNRDVSATNLIQIVIAIGGAAFGGYGWARSKHSKNKKDE